MARRWLHERDGDDPLTREIIAAAIEVHRHLRPGLLEHIYRDALSHELELRGHTVETEVPVPVRYKDMPPRRALRIDISVGGEALVEVKSVERLREVHEAQTISYLGQTDHRVGLLINFNVPRLVDGIRRFLP